MYTPGGGAGHCHREEAQRICGGAVSRPLGSPWEGDQSSASVTGREACTIARMPARIALGRLDQAAANSASSGSAGAVGSTTRSTCLGRVRCTDIRCFAKRNMKAA